MRTIDPDQEYQVYGTASTCNYVRYQPSTVALSVKFRRTESPNTALVCALGCNNQDFYLSMATVNSHSKATHFSVQVLNPPQAYINNAYKSYGGNDTQPTAAYLSRMLNDDQAIHLTYLYNTLNVGEVINLEYVHVLHPTEETQALDNLEHVLIAQPTDVLSGSSAVISLAFKNSKVLIQSAKWYLYATKVGQSVPGWYLVNAVPSATAAVANEPLMNCRRLGMEPPVMRQTDNRSFDLMRSMD